MQYAVFLRDEYILLSTFCRTSSTYTFCIFYNQPRNIRTTFYILHFAGRINFLSYLYILHSAGQDIFSTSFTLYIFRHLPNSASTFCLRHNQYLPDFFTRYHRIWRIFWSDISKNHRLVGDLPVKKEFFPQFSRILHTHLTFFVNSQKVQNTCTSRISWSWVLALHLHSTFFGDSDCMITSTFCILHMRVRARCLHSASTANSWKRRPTSIFNVQKVNKIHPGAYTSNISEPPNTRPALPVTASSRHPSDIRWHDFLTSWQ